MYVAFLVETNFQVSVETIIKSVPIVGCPRIDIFNDRKTCLHFYVVWHISLDLDYQVSFFNESHCVSIKKKKSTSSGRPGVTLKRI